MHVQEFFAHIDKLSRVLNVNAQILEENIFLMSFTNYCSSDELFPNTLVPIYHNKMVVMNKRIYNYFMSLSHVSLLSSRLELCPQVYATWSTCSISGSPLWFPCIILQCAFMGFALTKICFLCYDVNVLSCTLLGMWLSLITNIFYLSFFWLP